MATKYSMEFLEQRMEQHRRWQQQAKHLLMEEIICESQELPKRQPQTARLFEILPGHVQASLVTDLEAKQ